MVEFFEIWKNFAKSSGVSGAQSEDYRFAAPLFLIQKKGGRFQKNQSKSMRFNMEGEEV
ncbi:hypothetical protein [Anaeromassilibacillus sp. Marseille-P3371]|uniref:hypothetical protein n=1 Tax=Anaeromassilibacillus sp. Marseille-P3371 TaxID=1944639 RepID=UPI0013020609|nr:hypothetical protein [Anaeromassilibacillus sp. Marseille-P3371]MBS6236357.1 hypothetical protein [Clostridiales bacterium]